MSFLFLPKELAEISAILSNVGYVSYFLSSLLLLLISLVSLLFCCLRVYLSVSFKGKLAEMPTILSSSDAGWITVSLSLFLALTHCYSSDFSLSHLSLIFLSEGEFIDIMSTIIQCRLYCLSLTLSHSCLSCSHLFFFSVSPSHLFLSCIVLTQLFLSYISFCFSFVFHFCLQRKTFRKDVHLFIT